MPSHNTSDARSGALLLGILRYLVRPEAQTFAFSVATMAVLSFFPFMIVIMIFIRRGIESKMMYDVLLQILRDHLPIAQDLVIKTLAGMVGVRKQVQIISLLLLFFTARGVFMPLEVALNHIWGFQKARSWLHNQLVGAGLIFLCGGLAVFSVAFTAVNQYILIQFLGGRQSPVFSLGAYLLMKLVATAASVTIFFLVYWLVPSGKIDPQQVFPAALIFGLLWELAKYAYVQVLPNLNFQVVYGPFAVAVALVFWGYISGLVLLAGAYASARRHV